MQAPNFFYVFFEISIFLMVSYLETLKLIVNSKAPPIV
ncbi:MAG: hypothetical protein RL407_1345 [Bacteroidota bacterium]|jgi:hypothetical protein